MDWKQEMLKRLDALADKLGTTGAYLWQILVKQAYLTGVTDCIVAAILVILACVGVKYCIVLFKEVIKDDDMLEVAVLLTLLTVAVTVIGFVFLIVGVKELCNPAYYALHEVLKTLGK